MGLTRERIETILESRGYRAVFDEEREAAADAAPASDFAEARSPRLEVLQRRYSYAAGPFRDAAGDVGPDHPGRGEAPSRRVVATPSTPDATRGPGAIVLVEPLHGKGMRKAMVLSEEGEILGAQG